MQQPSEGWRKIQRATAERSYRLALEPFESIKIVYFAACVCYLTGFIRFKFFATGTDFTWITAFQLALVGVSGILVPILTGSVITFYLTGRRFRRSLLQ